MPKEQNEAVAKGAHKMLLNLTSEREMQGSISSTFCARIFHMKVLCKAFL